MFKPINRQPGISMNPGENGREQVLHLFPAVNILGLNFGGLPDGGMDGQVPFLITGKKGRPVEDSLRLYLKWGWDRLGETRTAAADAERCA
ncbi:hypothetical protein TH61_05495 [Rufibacter sp. DG15C]|nr:hypothetical protein TH61_05495 [Rufibacter sp. DG15C]